jgi:hypothetical protein
VKGCVVAGRSAGLPWPQPQPEPARCGKSRRKPAEAEAEVGRKRKEMLPRRRVDWRWPSIGLAARHGRVLLQPPGFAVRAPILWRTAVPRRAPPRPPGIWQAAGISRRFALAWVHWGLFRCHLKFVFFGDLDSRRYNF